MTEEKWTYLFGLDQTEGSGKDKNLLGSKGAHLAEMSLLDLPVPAGFTLPTEVCNYYHAHDKQFPSELKSQINHALKTLEEENKTKPLLLSIRPGTRTPMPNVMESILNLGLNDKKVKELANAYNDERFAYDCYRRFIKNYGCAVMSLEAYQFDEILDHYKTQEKLNNETDFTTSNWQDIVQSYKDLIKQETGSDIPENLHEQLINACHAYFDKWMSKSVTKYRKTHKISSHWGLALTIQTMVFGNLNDKSATGLAFTRNPSTGSNEFYGNFLINAQGKDILAGFTTPKQLDSLQTLMPEIFVQLNDIREQLEQHYKQMQEIEFTVQDGRLYMLQAQEGKRTTQAAIKIAVDMVDESLITKEEAIMRVNPRALDQLLHPTLDPRAQKLILTRGLATSSGIASGQLVFNTQDAEKLAAQGTKVILACTETNPEDSHSIYMAHGILTARGGMTSHAAVIARNMSKPCITGAHDITIHKERNFMTIGSLTLKKGDVVTLDGANGILMNGEVPTIAPVLSNEFETFIAWADEISRMNVKANAETIHDVETALKFGAKGLGLCRTEHMFFDPSRIINVREMILAKDKQERLTALSKLEQQQCDDFYDICKLMQGSAVTIRLLDPPFHEFLPQNEQEIENFAKHIGVPNEEIEKRISKLEEKNPLLGHRGCRLAISYPELYEMQVRALFKATEKLHEQNIKPPMIEVMIPLISDHKEFTFLKEKLETIMKETSPRTNYFIGAMIEVPRAALTAHKIAREAQFFSFGTNGLTQTTFGLSRDDAGIFREDYNHSNIITKDPFITLDKEAVGQLIQTAYNKGRSLRPDIKMGICGEHGSDPESIDFLEEVGLHYVSCAPYKIPTARLATAQAKLKYYKEVPAEEANKTAALMVV